jgi:hypothetical protein
MKNLLPVLAALGLLVGCSDADKIEKLEKALKSQGDRLLTLQEKQLLAQKEQDLVALKQKEEVARLRKERAALKKELQSPESELSEAAKLQLELDASVCA